MRFILIHKSNAHWETGVPPSKELIARVGALLGEMTEADVLRAGEGLRASSHGARVTARSGTCTTIRGPFSGLDELPAAFDIVRANSLDEAVTWASRLAVAYDEAEIEVRVVTEAWDIGIVDAPKGNPPRRYMLVRIADASSEAGEALLEPRRAAVGAVRAAMADEGVLVTSETLAPSARGKRSHTSPHGVRVIDGPFTESKELIAGYVILEVQTLEQAMTWVPRYAEVVGSSEFDLRELVGT